MLNDLPDIKYAAGAIAVGKTVNITGGLTASSAATLAAGTTIGGLTMADPNMFLPADHGFVAWSYDPSFASTTGALTAGTLYLSAVRLRRAQTITKVWWAQTTAASSVTSGQNYAALISSAGTVLSSVGIDSAITGSNNPISATLGAAQTNAPAGVYWVAILTNATTPPTLVRTNGVLTGLNNAGLTGATLRYAVNGTGLTALPGSITPSSNSVGPSWWVAVS